LETADSLTSEALVLEKKGKWEEALKRYEKALRIARSTSGQGEMRVANLLIRIAFLQWNKGEMGSFKSFYQEAYRIKAQLLGETHPEVAHMCQFL
jgi:tetratricopeptide (TPR) repeat protein